ncbi:MAG: outer membrane beta-barrel domain-containing protein [Steroidobacteraceae bacterium]
MESRTRVLLLSLALALCGSALSGCASLHWPWKRDKVEDPAPLPTDDNLERTGSPRVIDPEVARRTIKVPRINASNVELGGYFGALSIEDFTTNNTWGITAAYHVTEDFFFQAAYGRARAGKTSFETLGGNIQLLTPDERRFTYYNLSLGYNFLPGEVFLGRNRALTSAFYLLGGIGSSKFAGDQRFTVNFGAGFRVLPTDWLAIHIEAQDLVFQSDLLGEDKLTNNIGAHVGATVFF